MPSETPRRSGSLPSRPKSTRSRSSTLPTASAAFAIASFAIASLASVPAAALAHEAAHRAEFADERLPVVTIRTVPVQETTYRTEWSTEMIETPVKRWVPVPVAPSASNPRTAPAPWLFGGPALEWKLVEDKVRTPVTTSRIVPETRTVQKEVRMLAFEPGARALASTAALQPIPGANVVAGAGSPRVAHGASTTIPSTTVPAAPAPGGAPPAGPSHGLSPIGERSGFPGAPFPASPWVTPLQPVPSPTPWTAGTVGPHPQWGGLQRIDGDLPSGTLGAAGGLR